LLLLAVSVPGAAQEYAPYTAAKLRVDASAKDAVAAKEEAMAEAEAHAVEIVLRRLVPFAAQAQLPDLSQDDVEGLVYNVSFRGEQNSTTRYIATLDIVLNKEAVKQLLAKYKLSYSDARGPKIAVVPLVLEGEAVKRDGAGGWREAWANLDLAHSMVPADLVEPRRDLDAATVQALLAGNNQIYAQLKQQYGGDPLVVAVGEALPGGEFGMRLVGADGVGRINFGRIDTVQGSDIKLAAADAAADALGVLENRWKVMQSAPSTPEQASREEGKPAPNGEPQGEPERNVVAVVEFAGLKEWQNIRACLMNVPGLQGLEVNALSARTASVTFDYAGSIGRLQKELDQIGFVFENREDNFVIRAR
jgi:hypothetical protein